MKLLHIIIFVFLSLLLLCEPSFATGFWDNSNSASIIPAAGSLINEKKSHSGFFLGIYAGAIAPHTDMKLNPSIEPTPNVPTTNVTVKNDSVGLMGSFSTGYDYRFLRLEGEFGFTSANAKSMNKIQGATPDTSLSVQGQTDTESLMFNAIFNGIFSGFLVFGGAGIGPERVKFNYYGTPNIYNNATIAGDDTILGYQAIGGIGYLFDNKFEIDLRYRFHASNKAKFTVEDTLYATKTTFEPRYRSQSIDLGLKMFLR